MSALVLAAAAVVAGLVAREVFFPRDLADASVAANAWVDGFDAGDRAEVTRLTCKGDRVLIDFVTLKLEELGFTGERKLGGTNISGGSAYVSGTIETRSGRVPLGINVLEADPGQGERGWCVVAATVGS